MVPNIKDYHSCKVILYDESWKNTIAKTGVVKYDRSTATLIVDSRTFDASAYQCVSLLILDSGYVYECKGNIRRGLSKESCEIALFHAQEKEDRGAMRHVINAPAAIESLIISKKAVPLHIPFDVLVVNISVSGMLLRAAHSGPLNIGSAFQLKINIAGTDTVIRAAVTRISKSEPKLVDYGCKFLSIEEEPKAYGK